MEQFNLEEWLKDKSRKVVTRSGKQVKIISTEGRTDFPIIALIEGIAHQYKSNGFRADVIVACSNQCLDMGDYDLFFADEEELTEFEKELVGLVYGWCDSHIETPEEYINKHSQILLNLARKELMKDFPKWKKCDDNLPYSHIGGLNERYLIKKGYCMKISDLETLQKEE